MTTEPTPNRTFPAPAGAPATATAAATIAGEPQSEEFVPPIEVDSEVLDLYERMYVFELERREDQTNRLQLQLGLLAASFTAIGLVLTKFRAPASWLALQPDAGVGWMLGAAALFAVPAAVWFLIALAGKTYECMPAAHHLEANRQELFTRYASYPEQKEWTRGCFREQLLAYYADCAGRNAYINSDRYQAIHHSLKFTVISVVFAGLAGLMQWFALSGSTPP